MRRNGYTFLYSRAALVLVSAFLSLVLGEVVARLLLPSRLVISWADRIDGITTARADYQTHVVVPQITDFHVSINPQHFRGQRVYQQEPPLGVIRIAALGDSLTFGWGANNDETYPAQLERILAKSGGPSRIEVINAGVCGTGTGEQVLYYDIWVKHFHPSVLVLNVFVNDVGDDTINGFFAMTAGGKVLPRGRTAAAVASEQEPVTATRHEIFPGYFFLAQNSRLFSLSWDTAMQLRVRWSRGPSVQFQQEGLPTLAGEVCWLNERARESGARLAVVFIPPREAVYPAPTEWAKRVTTQCEAIVGTLRETCSGNAIPFVDLTSNVREEAGRVREPLYYPERDGHPTSRGYEVIAQAVATLLAEGRMIPPASTDREGGTLQRQRPDPGR
jgi:lysophospholipase L1-like esterase